MKYYKAFNHDMTCNGKQYAENTIAEVEGEAILCKNGIHFCENPLDTLDHYTLIDDEGNITPFAEVEPISETKTDDKGKKSVASKVRIGAKLTLKGFIEAAVEFVFEKTKKNTGDSSSLAASGYYSSLAASGDSSRLAASGHYSRLAASGYYSRLAASGDSVICCAAHGCTAKAGKGSWITLAEWGGVDCIYKPLCVKTEYVDGERIKENVFYKLEGGEFVEVDNDA